MVGFTDDDDDSDIYAVWKSLYTLKDRLDFHWFRLGQTWADFQSPNFGNSMGYTAK